MRLNIQFQGQIRPAQKLLAGYRIIKGLNKPIMLLWKQKCRSKKSGILGGFIMKIIGPSVEIINQYRKIPVYKFHPWCRVDVLIEFEQFHCRLRLFSI